MRRANHDRVTPPNAIPCPNCGDMMLPHRVCPACGQYKGRKVVATKDAPEQQTAPSE
jgi:large subunit ribosomal protein L32